MKKKFSIGLDVHKRFTAYAVRDKDGNLVTEGQSTSNPSDLYVLLEPYVISANIGMECNTEVYPIREYFLKKGYTILIANTTQLRNLVNKSDALDAKRLADMLRLGTFPEAYIPPQNIRQLRSIVQIRHSILKESTRKQNQIKAFARKAGICLPPKDSLSKKSIAIIRKYIIDNPTASELRTLLDMYLYTKNRLEQVTEEASVYAKSTFPKEFKALSRRKGIGPVITTYLISEICPISRFKSEKKLRRYAGVIPCSQETGGRTYSTFLPKTTSRGLLRWALVEAAQCMIKFDDVMKAYYKKKKKQKKIAGKAIMATASSIADMVFKILNSC